jgi:hypothetical protein
MRKALLLLLLCSPVYLGQTITEQNKREIIENRERLNQLEAWRHYVDGLNIDQRIVLNERTIAEITKGLETANSWLQRIAMSIFSIGGAIIIWLVSRLWIYVSLRPRNGERDTRMP